MKQVLFFLFSLSVIEIAKANDPVIDQKSGEYQLTYSPFFGSFQSKAIPESTISLSLKNNEVDLSSVFKIIDQLRESDYAGDLQKMEHVISDLRFQGGEIERLCETSSSKNNCIQNATDKMERAFLKIVQEKENQILYPEYYSRIYGRSQKLNDDMIQEANEILDSECLEDYNVERLSWIINTLHPNRWPELQDKLKYTDKSVLKEVLKIFHSDLEHYEYPEQCLDPANQSHRVCKRVKKELTIRTQRYTYLTELVYGRDILQTTEAKAPCLDCVEGSLSTELSDLNHLFSRLKEHSLCSDPAPGEEKQVTHNRFGGPYTVRRDTDGSFSIPLNLAFSADEDYDGEIPRDQVPAHYKNKVQECLKKANSKMLGPNGEKLNIVIGSPTKEGCRKKYPLIIRIGSSDHRSNSRKYEADIDCPAITHEVLHLLGLCDEYKEGIKGFQVSADTGEVKPANISERSDNENDQFVLAYDCRVTSQNSIMSDPNYRWNSVFFSGSQLKSLLQPRQFNRILYGDCPSKNKLYNECADLAYRSSVKEGNEDCLKQKRKCIENNAMGKNKAEESSRIREYIRWRESMKRATLRQLQEMQAEGSQADLSQLEELNDTIQRFDSELKKSREELEIVLAWPD